MPFILDCVRFIVVKELIMDYVKPIAPVIKNNYGVGRQHIIGIKNMTSGAGATTLTYMLKNELSNSCISYPNFKTFFTNNYIISYYYRSFAIKYSDIILMYPYAKYSSNGNYVSTDLWLKTKSKRNEGIQCNDEFIKIILAHNPSIMYGNTKENRKKYKEIIKNIQR